MWSSVALEWCIWSSWPWKRAAYAHQGYLKPEDWIKQAGVATQLVRPITARLHMPTPSACRPDPSDSTDPDPTVSRRLCIVASTVFDCTHNTIYQTLHIHGVSPPALSTPAVPELFYNRLHALDSRPLHQCQLHPDASTSAAADLSSSRPSTPLAARPQRTIR